MVAFPLLFLLAPLFALVWGAVIALAYTSYVVLTVATQIACALIATEQRYAQQRAERLQYMAQLAQAHAAAQPKRRRRA